MFVVCCLEFLELRILKKQREIKVATQLKNLQSIPVSQSISKSAFEALIKISKSSPRPTKALKDLMSGKTKSSKSQ